MITPRPRAQPFRADKLEIFWPGGRRQEISVHSIDCIVQPKLKAQ
jgi:hypothetical protein